MMNMHFDYTTLHKNCNCFQEKLIILLYFPFRLQVFCLWQYCTSVLMRNMRKSVVCLPLLRAGAKKKYSLRRFSVSAGLPFPDLHRNFLTNRFFGNMIKNRAKAQNVIKGGNRSWMLGVPAAHQQAEVRGGAASVGAVPHNDTGLPCRLPDL